MQRENVVNNKQTNKQVNKQIPTHTDVGEYDNVL